MKKNIWGVLFLAVCFLFLAFVIYQIFGEKVLKKKSSLPPAPPTGTAGVFPTKTPEEIAVISQIETKNIEITSTAITPQSLTIKPHDQVAFYNKSGVEIRVVGEGWGNITLESDENMTQSFQKPGEFTYRVTGLDKGLEGKVVVK